MITIDIFEALVYLLALGAYAYLGFGFIGLGMLMTMDTGPRPWSAIYFLIIAALWGAGLYYGTQAYFN